MWLGALQWRNSASEQGKYYGLEITQFRFHTINLVRLEVSQFCFRKRALTLNPAIPPPHKEYSVTWISAVSLPYKEYTMSRSSAVLLSHTEQCVTWSSAVSHNILRLEFPQFCFRKKRRHLKFRTSASAREHYFSFENPLSFSHPPISQFSCCLAWMLDPLKDREAKESGYSWPKSSLTCGCAKHKLMTQLSRFATEKTGRLRATTGTTRRFYYVDTLTSTLWTATVSARRYGLPANTIHNLLWKMCGPPLKGQTMTRRHRFAYVQWAGRHFIWWCVDWYRVSFSG